MVFSLTKTTHKKKHLKAIFSAPNNRKIIEKTPKWSSQMVLPEERDKNWISRDYHPEKIRSKPILTNLIKEKI